MSSKNKHTYVYCINKAYLLTVSVTTGLGWKPSLEFLCWRLERSARRANQTVHEGVLVQDLLLEEGQTAHSIYSTHSTYDKI